MLYVINKYPPWFADQTGNFIIRYMLISNSYEYQYAYVPRTSTINTTEYKPGTYLWFDSRYHDDWQIFSTLS